MNEEDGSRGREICFCSLAFAGCHRSVDHHALKLHVAVEETSRVHVQRI